MLFDLKGRRKRFIQVSYVILAFLFAVGLIGFGIGGGVSGGFFDAITGGGGGGGGSDISKKEAQRAERAVRANPKNERAWLALARAEYNSAVSGDDYNRNTGEFSEGAGDVLGRTTRAWERYLALDPKKPDPTAATLVIRAYAAQIQLGSTDSPLRAFKRAGEAQEIIAKARPSSIAYFQLAQIRYAIGRIEQGDRAADEAIRRTPRDQRNTVRAQLDDGRKEGLKAKRQVKKAEEQADEAARKARRSGQDPFGATPGQSPLGG
jgi:tetratricopeptide (TPR) repeat protein